MLDDDVLNLLPATARNALGKTKFRFPVVAECRSVETVSDRLTLYAFRVEPALDSDRRRAFATSAVDSPARAGRGGARTAIMEAIRRLTTRAGSEVVTIQEVVDELRRSASPYAESTIRTMMSSHMCAQARGPGIGNQDDLDRIDRGRYRLRQPRK